MEKIINILERYQPHRLFKHSQVVKESKQLLKNPIIASSLKKIATPLDYYQAKIIQQGILNKERLEKSYEGIRKDNEQLWNFLNYQEKVRIAALDGQAIRKSLFNFKYEDQVIFIPFFDLRLNHYYTNEMVIFDLPQYFNIYNNYSNWIISVSFYGGAPYDKGFAPATCLAENASGYVLWDAKYQIMTLCQKTAHSFTLSSQNTDLYTTDLKPLAQALLDGNGELVIELLINQRLVSSKTVSKLSKIKKEVF